MGARRGHSSGDLRRPARHGDGPVGLVKSVCVVRHPVLRIGLSSEGTFGPGGIIGGTYVPRSPYSMRVSERRGHVGRNATEGIPYRVSELRVTLTSPRRVPSDLPSPFEGEGLPGNESSGVGV